MMWELSIEDGIVNARSKERMAAEFPWSAKTQIFPHRSTPHVKAHAPDVVPRPAPTKEWIFRDLVIKDLTQFYSDRMDFIVCDIPEDVRASKCSFCT